MAFARVSDRGFGYSQGLETPMSTGVVATAAEVERWVRDVLRHGAGAWMPFLWRGRMRAMTPRCFLTGRWPMPAAPNARPS
ncbi:hypothetical protein ACFSHQ_05640 [Gemmobacter lanyuensis]